MFVISEFIVMWSGRKSIFCCWHIWMNVGMLQVHGDREGRLKSVIEWESEGNLFARDHRRVRLLLYMAY